MKEVLYLIGAYGIGVLILINLWRDFLRTPARKVWKEAAKWFQS